jgi:hypothetical protein
MAPRNDVIREKVQATKDIREGVRKELDFDPLVDAAGITVKNMNGDVALNGTVPSYLQYLDAAAAAKRVSGVTKVHNHLAVVLPPASYRAGRRRTAGTGRPSAAAAGLAGERALTATCPDGAGRSLLAALPA